MYIILIKVCFINMICVKVTIRLTVIFIIRNSIYKKTFRRFHYFYLARAKKLKSDVIKIV